MLIYNKCKNDQLLLAENCKHCTKEYGSGLDMHIQTKIHLEIVFYLSYVVGSCSLAKNSVNKSLKPIKFDWCVFLF